MRRLFATAGEMEPLEFTLGTSDVLPAIEEALEGMEPGESRTVLVPADEAFGPRREELVGEVPLASLPEDLNVEIGQQLQVSQPGTEPMIVSVIDTSDYSITIDANHPLAGEDLVFDLELMDVDDQ